MTQGIDQTRILRSFRRGLDSYHDAATVQAQIATQLLQLLQENGAPRALETAYEFGCGSGHLTRRLRQGLDIATLHLNDLVPECSARVAGLGDSFTAGPIETAALPQGLNLIASASTVQWVTDLPALLERLTGKLAPGGWLAISGFSEAQFPELRALGSQAHAPGALPLAQWRAAVPAGLSIRSLTEDRMTVTFDGALSLLRHLRDTGVNAGAHQHWTRARLNDFETRYRRRFGQEGKLPLTYAPVWLIARKTA